MGTASLVKHCLFSITTRLWDVSLGDRVALKGTKTATPGTQAQAPRKLWCHTVRTAFGILDLIVTLSILGVLVALLLPAVQAARESARTLKCKSNLRQLGLAFISFENTFGRFPKGGWGFRWHGYSDVATSGLSQPGSWNFSILPHLELAALYDTPKYFSSDLDRNHQLEVCSNTQIPVFQCPTRRQGQLLLFDQTCTNCSLPIGATRKLSTTHRLDYAVNIGDGNPDLSNIGFWPIAFDGPQSLAHAKIITERKQWPKIPIDWTGISWLNESARIAQIEDGTSQTIMIGEKYVNRDRYLDGNDWGDNEAMFSGFNNDNHRSTNPFWPYARDGKEQHFFGSFGSAHHNSSNFVFCDGSVHELNYQIITTVFQGLGNRRDGKTPPP